MNRTTVTTCVATVGLAAIAALAVATPALARAGAFTQAGELIALSKATPATVPAGAAARLHTVNLPEGGSRWTLHVKGLAADRTYGVHAHADRCNASTPGGGHYRIGEPVNAQTEVWLDVHTNASGNGRAVAEQSWQFTPEKPPLSVIIHADSTSDGTDSRPVGSAGPRLACLDLHF